MHRCPCVLHAILCSPEEDELGLGDVLTTGTAVLFVKLFLSCDSQPGLSFFLCFCLFRLRFLSLKKFSLCKFESGKIIMQALHLQLNLHFS